MISRDDLSNRLIHFTKGQSKKGSPSWKREAEQVFLDITQYGSLQGGIGKSPDSKGCICFTESPIAKFPTILSSALFPYAPLGVMVSKSWLFARGGRPVVYQPDAEIGSLTQDTSWRHKHYDPKEPGKDYTWEREWRIRENTLHLDDSTATAIVPTRVFLEIYLEDINKEPKLEVLNFL